MCVCPCVSFFISLSLSLCIYVLYIYIGVSCICIFCACACVIHTYIYSHLQTDCFVISKLFSVARHAGRSKPGSKPVQLYVRLSFRPLGHQADHVGLGNF